MSPKSLFGDFEVLVLLMKFSVKLRLIQGLNHFACI